MHGLERVLVFGAVVLLLWICAAIVSWILGKLRAFFSSSALPPIEPLPDDWAMVNAVIANPVQRPDGTWEKAELTWKTTDAPIHRGELVVHNRQDPEHVAECSLCRNGPKLSHSGISWRNN